MISKLWHLSLKMLSAKKERALFSILAIALSVGLLCSMFQLHMMFNQDLQQRAENEYGSADIRVSSPAPTDGNEWSGLDTSILKDLQSFDHIHSVGLALEGKMAERILYENQIDVINDTGFYYVGVDNTRVTKDYYKFEKDLSDYEVALTQSLAHRWNVSVTDSISINLLNGNGVTWKVAEVLQPMKMTKVHVDDWVFFHLSSLQEVLGLPETFNPALIAFEPEVNLQLIGYDLKNQLPKEVRVEALQGLEDEEDQYTFFRVYGYILSIIAFMASIILVYSMMQITYRERLRELAVIRAVGGSPKQLMKMVIYEWAFIGAIGSLLGFLLAWSFSSSGITWLSSLFNLDLGAVDVSGGVSGMLITALLSWFVVLFASLGIVRKVSQTEPVQSFCESLNSVPTHSSRRIMWIICTVMGLLFWSASYFLSASNNIIMMNLRVMFSMFGGLLFITALLSATVWLGISLLNLITLLPHWMVGRLFRLSAQRLVVERSQMLSVILMALVITVYIPIATVFQFMGQSSSVSLAEELNADFSISAEQAFHLTSAPEMPWHLKYELEETEWVDKVLPLPGNHFAELDITEAQTNLISEDQLSISYGVTDLHALVEWGLASFSDSAVEDAGILPQHLANELGIQIGDSLPLIVNGKPTSVTIVDITDKLDQLPYYQSTLFINENHSNIHPGNLSDMLIGINNGYDEQMKQKLNLLQRVYPEMRWLETAESLSTFEATRQQILAMLQGITIIIIIGGIGGVLNAMNAGIHARRREYAILRSIHLTPFQIMKLVAWQGVILSVLSLIIGTISASILLFSVYNSSSGFTSIFEYIPYKNVMVLYVLLSVISTFPIAKKIAGMKIMAIFNTDD